MARKINASQFKSKMQQLQNKQKQAIRNYNNAVNDYNRKLKTAVNKYNQAVRTHNANVRRNRTIINNQLRQLQSTTTTTRIQYNYRISSLAMNNSYNNVIGISDYLENLSPQQEFIYDLIEQEHANNLATANAILDDKEPEFFSEHDLAIGNQLAAISEDLDARWKGAVFSLNPANPDATRHFCTSAREIFTEAIEITAPDSAVFAANPNCEKTERGNATRRAKIAYLLTKKGLDVSVGQFAYDDITNILELFHVLSEGTHGIAGKYSMAKLKMVKKRVEDGIIFLCNIASFG
ncbi:MAG: hypothetical protein HPY50_00380 [Firmicutes bacterium]|nr:hypothetical protein [Bacillota bacterium]